MILHIDTNTARLMGAHTKHGLSWLLSQYELSEACSGDGSTLSWIQLFLLLNFIQH